MGFRDNLQHLRAERHMTQEQLAAALGVSRQSVTKWEAEKSYPEMDKLIKLCELFGCTLDDLVLGDLTGDHAGDPAAQPLAAQPGEPAEPDEPQCTEGSVPPVDQPSTEDIYGYDAHMRSFSLWIATGVALCILSVAAASAFDDFFFVPALHNEISFAAPALFVGILLGLACLIPAGIEHAAYVKEHPYIEDFYTSEEKTVARRFGAASIVIGIGLIFAAIIVGDILDDTSYQAGTLLLLVAAGVWVIIRGGMMWNRTNIADYNKEALEDLRLEDIENAQLDDEHKQHLAESIRGKRGLRARVTSTVCGTIMLVATIIALLWLFSGPITSGGWDNVKWASAANMFWVPWPIGGICCAIATLIINAVIPDEE